MAVNSTKTVTSYPSETAQKDLDLLREVSAEAGKIAMSFFNRDNKVWKKSGDSPVSEADFAVDNFLRETLTKARPEYGWLSEETEDNADRLQKETIFLADPIDGTRGFIAGNEKWCVSLAIIHKEIATVGVLECPALAESYYGLSGSGSYLNGTKLALTQSDKIGTITGSRKLNSYLHQSLAGKVEVLEFVPSLAYRLAMVANGKVDAGVARAGAHDWDLAAADVILREAGGFITDVEGHPLRFNRKITRSGSLVAAGPGKHAVLLELAKTEGFLQ